MATSTSFKKVSEKLTQILEHEILPKIKLEQLPESLTCYFCKGLLKRPQQLSCGHRICKSCVEPFMNYIQPDKNGIRYCPEDEDELDEQSFPDNSALKEIMLLECKCIRNEEGCPWSGLILEIEEHLNFCEYNIKMSCQYEKVGCNLTGSRQEILKHYEDKRIFHEALTAASLHSIKQQTGVNETLSEQVKKKGENLSQSVKTLKDELKNMTDDLNESEYKIDEGFPGFDDLMKQMESFNRDSGKIYELQKRLDEQIAKTESLQELVKISVGDTTSGGSVVTYDQKVDSMNQKLGRLDETHQQNLKQMSQIDIKTKLFQSTTFDGNFIWKLDNLQKRNLDAVSGKVSELFTPPLHTARYGYKYCAKVLLNGEAKQGDRSPHISLYVILMQGDYDEILQWPFPHVIKITLVNMGKKKNIERRLIPRPELVHFQKPFKDMNPAVGFPRFCSHDSLYSEGFVKEDSIFIKIEVEK